MTQRLTRPTTLAYGDGDLTPVERQILAAIRLIQRENGGEGYGQVNVSIQAGRVETIRHEVITKVRP